MQPTFICAACKGEFPFTVEDEAEADREAALQFAQEVAAGEPMEIVCDDCYEEIMASLRAEQTGETA